MSQLLCNPHAHALQLALPCRSFAVLQKEDSKGKCASFD